MTIEALEIRLVNAVSANPKAALDLLLAVDEVIADFHEWGPVLQADEDGQYTEETAIVQLQRARDALKRLAGWAVD